MQQPAADAVGLVLAEDVRLGGDVRFGAHSVVCAGAVLGDGCTVGAHVVIHEGSVLGAGCGSLSPSP